MEPLDVLGTSSLVPEENVDVMDASNYEAKGLLIIDNNTEHCSICLDTRTNVSLVDPCYHSFCFVCIFQWSQFNPSCPLCKRAINLFIHDIKSDTEFKTTKLEPKNKAPAPKVDRWGCPSSSTIIHSSHFPFTPAHERRKRVYQRQIIPISPLSRTPKNSNSFICTTEDWDRKVEAWITRELQSIMEEEDVATLILIFEQIFINHKGHIQSPELFKEIEGFLQQHTPIFIRELHYFMASSLNVLAYDKQVWYRDIDDIKISGS